MCPMGEPPILRAAAAARARRPSHAVAAVSDGQGRPCHHLDLRTEFPNCDATGVREPARSELDCWGRAAPGVAHVGGPTCYARRPRTPLDYMQIVATVQLVKYNASGGVGCVCAGI